MSRQLTAAKRRKYDTSMVNPVVEMVRSGQLTLGQAARAYSIPKSTLHDRLKNKYTTDHIGVSTVLSEEEERRIVQWALHMSQIGYGRTRQELAATVKSIIDEDGRHTKFKDNKPGRQWFRGFFSRHPELTVRTTMQLGKERAIISKEKITRWFAELERYVNEEVKDPELLQDPSRIYNADESGFSLCPSKGSKVVGSKGAPVVYHYGNSDKTQLTVMAAASAIGHFVQPMIIYPGQRFSYEPLEGFEEAAFGRSESGWMDSEVFVMWLKKVFVPEIEARHIKKPVLLLIDGHSTHVSMEASDTCLAHGIEMYCLLEHSSHIMQPLDLRFFASLKSAWRQAVRDYQTRNIGEFVTKKTFARVFKEAWRSSATVEAAVRGFNEAGLFPLDVNKVVGSIKIEPSKMFSCTPAGDGCSVNEQSAVASVSGEVQNISKTSQASDGMDGDQEPATQEDDDSMTQALDVTQPPTPQSEEKSAHGDESKQRSPSPFSKYLAIPAKIQQSKSKKPRDVVAKAITGKDYRAYLIAKQEKKEQLAREKEARKQERVAKKQQREKEKKHKQELKQRRKDLREEKKRERMLKLKKKRAEEERIMKEIEASDGEDGVQEEPGKCYHCDKTYADNFIQCTHCFRKFHVECVEDEMICDTEDIPFECKYC